MKPLKTISPTQVTRGTYKKKFNSKHKLSITRNSSNSKAKSQALPTKNTNNIGNIINLLREQQLVSIFLYSNGRDEAQTHLIHWGVPAILHSVVLAFAEHEAALIQGGV
ncbi:hypothetical protein ACSQ6I_23535 [Anabaena sp. WFMT]|uniref:hypothetical protein n=1 Tax=Anabaena sp. WFMT TaxID=3449730 RepID=UPI003F29AA01